MIYPPPPGTLKGPKMKQLAFYANGSPSSDMIGSRLKHHPTETWAQMFAQLRLGPDARVKAEAQSVCSSESLL